LQFWNSGEYLIEKDKYDVPGIGNCGIENCK